MQVGGGMWAFPARWRASGHTLFNAASRIWVGGAVSFLGYMLVFIALHLNSNGWASGQIFVGFSSYWRFFYATVAGEAQVMADPRSAEAVWHPVVLLAAFAVVATGYLLLLSTIRALPVARRPRLKTLLSLALLLSIPLLLLPNLLSGDIYSYISFGRIAALFGGNPFADAPGRFAGDPYLKWVDWTNVPSVYGPGWIYPSMVLTYLVEMIWPSVVSYVLAYKLLALGLHLLNGVLLWAILARWRPEQQAWGTALYLLNPLPLIEFAGNGHNDALMIALILCAVLLHLRRQSRLAVAALMLAVLVKWIALPLLGLYGVMLLRQAGSVRSGLRVALTSAAICLALAVGLYAPYWRGLATLDVLWTAPPQQRLINSFGALFVYETENAMYGLGRWPHPSYVDWKPLALQVQTATSVNRGEDAGWRERQRVLLQRYNQLAIGKWAVSLEHDRMLSGIARLVGLGIVAAACLAGLRFTRDLNAVLLSSAWILFAYITVGAVWVWPWYATWFIALAALLDWRVAGRTAMILGITTLLIYPLYPHMPEPSLIERWRALLAFGPPLAFVLYQIGHRLIPRHTRRGTGNRFQMPTLLASQETNLLDRHRKIQDIT